VALAVPNAQNEHPNVKRTSSLPANLALQRTRFAPEIAGILETDFVPNVLSPSTARR
jgi:hypothetical protein